MAGLRKLKKKLWIGVGIICFLLAIIAYIVPLIPTPPFLAASLYCFAKGSRRFHDWLLYRTIFGKHFLIYREKGTLPKRFKYTVILILFLGCTFSTLFVFNSWWLRGALIFFTLITIIALLKSKNTEDL